MANDNIFEWIIVGIFLLIPWVYMFYETHLEHKERGMKKLPKEEKVESNDWK